MDSRGERLVVAVGMGPAIAQGGERYRTAYQAAYVRFTAEGEPAPSRSAHRAATATMNRLLAKRDTITLLVLDTVCQEASVSLDVLRAPGRWPFVVEARRVAASLINELAPGAGPTYIAYWLQRDHTTVLHHLSVQPTEDERTLRETCRAEVTRRLAADHESRELVKAERRAGRAAPAEPVRYRRLTTFDAHLEDRLVKAAQDAGMRALRRARMYDEEVDAEARAERILVATCAACGVSRDDLLSPERSAPLVRARVVAAHLLTEAGGVDYAARHLGRARRTISEHCATAACAQNMQAGLIFRSISLVRLSLARAAAQRAEAEGKLSSPRTAFHAPHPYMAARRMTGLA